MAARSSHAIAGPSRRRLPVNLLASISQHTTAPKPTSEPNTRPNEIELQSSLLDSDVIHHANDTEPTSDDYSPGTVSTSTSIFSPNDEDNAPELEPLTEDPLTDEPLTEEPLTDEPLTDEPLTDDPLTDEPLTDEPLTDDAAGHERGDS